MATGRYVLLFRHVKWTRSWPPLKWADGPPQGRVAWEGAGTPS